ncbi:UPF0489 family protein [Bacteroides acidifaciens]|uniref:UPF0489 family protein n=1 Tax=Bacteroides acidifaciens TaxID=85831 RepID=UPI002557D0C2|nr:UPF0489 family protein [Bacteroides acidifaciens]
MWIKELPENLQEQESNITNLNFLYKEKNIYVMDNHLAAGWSWLQELNPKESYNFFHIDRHADLLCNAPVDKYLFIKDNPHLTFDEYTNLEFKDKCSDYIYKVFQWDNYIKQINYLFPNWFTQCYFATHKRENDSYPESTKKLDIVYQPNVFELYNSIDYWLKEGRGTKWIFNIDLDYFFNEDGIQLFTDDYIKATVQSLKNGIEYVAVLTIALSPECCGGWDNAIRIMNIVTEELGLELRL